MKNIKINEKLKDKIILGGLSLVLVSTGYGMGRLNSKNNNLSESSNIAATNNNESVSEIVNQYLGAYIEKRDALDKEIDSLLEQKERLQNVKTFNMANLIVMENTNEDNKSDLYILYRVDGISDIYYEYHDDFKAWYRLHPDTDKHRDVCACYIHFNDCEPLFNYLTDEEIERLSKNRGEITTLELDEILARIRSEYQEKHSKKVKEMF